MSFRLTLCVFILIPLASQFAFSQQTQASAFSTGAAVFSQRCAKCHGEGGEGLSGAVTIAGPNLQAEHDVNTVLRAVRNGQGLMPSFNNLLSPQERTEVAGYVTKQLATIPLTGGNLSEGGILFRMYCAPCHRTAGRGGALAFTGTNAPSLTDKSAAVIAGAIRWGPGAMPAFPVAEVNDQQLASIVTYVKFVQRPPSPGGSGLGFYGPVAEGFAAWVGLFLLVIAAGWIERGGKG
jgi:ubiquinol-cytochrome c reductase cytochrome c subunit